MVPPQLKTGMATIASSHHALNISRKRVLPMLYHEIFADYDISKVREFLSSQDNQTFSDLAKLNQFYGDREIASSLISLVENEDCPEFQSGVLEAIHQLEDIPACDIPHIAKLLKNISEHSTSKRNNGVRAFASLMIAKTRHLISMGNLVLARKPGESITIGDNIIVKIVGIRGRNVRLAITAPTNVNIKRKERA